MVVSFFHGPQSPAITGIEAGGHELARPLYIAKAFPKSSEENSRGT
jgi:hypothetical protein